MKEPLTEADLINWWLEKYHNTDLQKVAKLHPEWMDGEHARDFYETYQVTQEQHDEWHKWAVKEFARYFKVSKKLAQKNFVWTYLNVSPQIKEK